MVSILSVAIQPHVFLIAKALLTYSFLASPVFLFRPVSSREIPCLMLRQLFGGMLSVVVSSRKDLELENLGWNSSSSIY